MGNFSYNTLRRPFTAAPHRPETPDSPETNPDNPETKVFPSSGFFMNFKLADCSPHFP